MKLNTFPCTWPHEVPPDVRDVPWSCLGLLSGLCIWMSTSSDKIMYIDKIFSWLPSPKCWFLEVAGGVRSLLSVSSSCLASSLPVSLPLLLLVSLLLVFSSLLMSKSLQLLSSLTASLSLAFLLLLLLLLLLLPSLLHYHCCHCCLFSLLLLSLPDCASVTFGRVQSLRTIGLLFLGGWNGGRWGEVCSHVTTAWRRCNHNITLLRCAFSPKRN